MGVKVCPDNAQVIDEHKKAEKDRREAHTKTLDDLVNVNSLFTLAVFVGLSQASPGAISLENKEECNAGPGVAKMLVLYEVVAFACFLLSSLVAKVIKLLLGLDSERFKFVHDRFDFKDFLLILTASSSVSGIILLTLSVVNIVQIRIGLYSCASAEARRAIWALCTIVAIALVIYVVSLIIAIYASITTDGQYSSSSKENSDKKRGDVEKDDRSAGSVEGQ
ncbi:Maternal effect embryoarrest [Heracleum sosnowskyi]|uniref:Maternal effect embryoarrest n=1 Tax=Heracleum sosnowskyi TaxID=360622 RepID=A0AAD8I0L1_9APIA|nr:Maternal effect embryoarrest [Heracleum sosnowskyi]